ncbi:MAG: glycosyltransferase [Pseudomonadota bacterium]|nr:glycosyltransferase [Pseudomonadota bacterium]
MPPAYHVVAAVPLDEAKTRAEIAAGERPGYFLLSLADELGAALYEPRDGEARAPGFLENHLLRPPPRILALADRVAAAAKDEDVVFCIAEGVGLALAANFQRSGKKTRLAVFAHNIVRPRMHLAMIATPWFRRIDRLYAISPRMVETARRRLPSMAARIVAVDEQADEAFFSPGAARPKTRPLIVGVGLEQRDYRTLAAAIDGLDVEVRISAFSKDARQQRESLPDAMPANMSSAFYPWRDLVQLYRDADLVVAPLLPNNYAAGITTLLEAASVGKPVVATRTAGIEGVFSDPEAIAWVPPQDAAALRAEIEALLADKARRDALAARARAAFDARHRKSGRVKEMADDLRSLAAR